MPKEIKDYALRDDFSSEVYWNHRQSWMSVSSYVVPKRGRKKKNILVLATKPILKGVTKNRRKKPGIVKEYDFTKCGVDQWDQR